MKLKLISLSALLLICSISFSQGLNFGIKGGASINKIDGLSFKDEFTYGYHLGAFATIGLGKKFAIQPEVLFNQFKTDTSSAFSAVYPSFNKVKNIKLNYLSIPILLNYNVSNLLALQERGWLHAQNFTQQKCATSVMNVYKTLFLNCNQFKISLINANKHRKRSSYLYRNS